VSPPRPEPLRRGAGPCGLSLPPNFPRRGNGGNEGGFKG